MSSAAQKISSVLLARTLPPLSPLSIYDPSLTSQIDTLNSDPVYLRAALHLANDDIDRAHELAQGDEGNETSDYLHGMLHRREGDYWNSKWWLGSGMRTVHPVLKSVHGGVTGGKKFVDACEKVGKGRNEDLEKKQWEELQGVVKYALKKAGGGQNQ